MKILKDLTRWIFYFPFGFIISRLPRNWIRVIANIAGSFIYHICRTRRIIAQQEINKLFGQVNDQVRLKNAVKNGFKVSIFTLLETFCFPRLTPNNIHRWIQLEGKEKLDKAIDDGKAVIIILIHFGANQMIMPALGFRGYKINQLGSRPDDWNRLSGIQPTAIQEKIFEKRLYLERFLPANFIYIDKTMRPIYQCLQSNEIMLMAVDGRAGTRFLKATILKRKINLSAGPFRIARKTKAALIPVFPVCTPKGTHILSIHDEIKIDYGLTEEEWLTKAAVTYGKCMEEMVKNYPDHYSTLMTEAKIRADLDPVPLFEDSGS